MPGDYRGRHFTTYVKEVERLIRRRDHDTAEKLLLALVDATEAESRAERCGVAPWYYEQLAHMYRDRNDLSSETQILERFAKQRHAPGSSPPKLLKRLATVRRMLDRAPL